MRRTFLEWFSGMKETGLETIVTAGENGVVRVLKDDDGIHFRNKGKNEDLYGTPILPNQNYGFVPYRNGETALLYVNPENELNVVSQAGNINSKYQNVQDFRVIPFGDKTLVATTPMSVDDLFSQRNGAEVVHTSDFRVSIQCHEIGDVIETEEGAYLPLRFGQEWKYMDEGFNYHPEILQVESLGYKKVANG